MQIHNRSIIMGTNKETLNQIIQKNQKTLKIIDELPLINGYVVKGTISDDLFKNASSDISIIKDQHIPWIKPVKIREVATPIVNESLIKNKQTLTVTLDLARHLSTLEMQKVWEKGYTGKGVGIAILDSGIFPHDDLKDRIAVFKDFTSNGKDVEPFDPLGHGTHVAGDAASSGKSSNGVFRGPAYEATLIGLKIGDNRGPTLSSVIKAIQWLIDNKEKHNIRLMNMSFGLTQTEPWNKDPIVMAVEKAYKAGILACVAAGNEGPRKGSIATPAIAPHAITIGAMDERGTAFRGDDKVASFSSRGPTKDNLRKPNVISPGVDIIAPKAGTSDKYVSMDGTSMASPVAMGVLATWIQANPKITPDELIDIASKTAILMRSGDRDELDQGKGMIDPVKGLNMVLKLKNITEIKPA